MTIDIIIRNSCSPCQYLVEAIQEYNESNPEKVINYNLYISGDENTELKKQEHLNRGLPFIGVPTWITYDENGQYQNTYLGFIHSELYVNKLKIFKETIENNQHYLHPLEEPLKL
jgi:thioredoxin-related protein